MTSRTNKYHRSFTRHITYRRSRRFGPSLPSVARAMTNADNVGPVNVAAAIATTTTIGGRVYGRRPVPVRESTIGNSSSHAPA